MTRTPGPGYTTALRTRRQLLQACGGAGLAILTACTGSSGPTPPASAPTRPSTGAATAAPVVTSAVTLKFAFAGGLGSAGLYLALDRGYLQAEGLSFDEVRFDTSAGMIPSLSTGQVDFGVGGVTAGLFNSIAQGIAVRLALDAWTAYPGNGAGGLLVRQDLVESGRVRGPGDLRGRRVAVTAHGQATEFTLDRGLAAAGLSLTDVDVTELSYPNMTAALANKNIDAAISIEPFATQAVLKGIATRSKTWAELAPNDATAMVLFSQLFAEGRNDAARRFAKAYVHGVRDYETARTGGQGRDEVVESLIRHLDLKDRAVYDQMPWPSINPNGRLNAGSFAAAQDWCVEHGYVPKRVDLAQVVDSQFADYAVAQLGPYQA